MLEFPKIEPIWDQWDHLVIQASVGREVFEGSMINKQGKKSLQRRKL